MRFGHACFNKLMARSDVTRPDGSSTFSKRHSPKYDQTTLPSLFLATVPRMNSHDNIRALVAETLETNVKPEQDLFDAGMVLFAGQLIAEGLLKPPYHFNIILGNIAGTKASIKSQPALYGLHPKISIVCLLGVLGTCKYKHICSSWPRLTECALNKTTTYVYLVFRCLQKTLKV